MNPKILTTILLGLMLAACRQGDWKGNLTGAPVVSSLFNNRMLLLLKATYATDNPQDFSQYNGGTGALYQDDVPGDPAFNLTGLPLAKNLPIFIDIGEIRISSKYQQGLGNLSQITTTKQSKAFWDFIAPNREVFCTVPYTLNSNTCRSQNGEFKMQQLLNGDGAQYDSNDPTEGTSQGNPSQYYYTGVFLRSMVTAWGNIPNVDLTTITFFDNYPIGGFNIVPRMAYVPGALTKSTTPLIFPLLYSMGGDEGGPMGNGDMEFRPGYEPYIFEVRMNLKENLMVHSFAALDGSNAGTLVAVSDWNVDHQGQTDIGGNLLLRSRTIYPSSASRLLINGGSGSTYHYYGIFRDTEINLLKKLPLIASPALSGATPIKYIMPGQYQLVCLGDIARVDGFPDTIVRQTTFSVPPNGNGNTMAVSLNCP
ncbi:putative lipoprotein [Leptospira inadai serovar Lyme str. 10]|uniref:Lipoprotein n=2 Tax=Leptospira inadai serovar Lyme TaxID=293084 RepID=A0ABX4YEV8_9LEPT|nr:hypothetical protein [Leptospira inadai]EQA37866.1 putative lipoprotein [Leptospira inadai serovar Lyme str. 10]PNV73388.1 hypothetical protein BES34_017395 [Leptospira inadai serovar Lyme]